MKKKDHLLFGVVAIGLIGIAAVFFFLILPRWLSSPQPAETTSIGYGSDAVRAEIVDVIEEGTVQLGEQEQEYQIFRIELLEGEFAGTLMEIEYGKRQIRPDGLDLAPGDRIIVTVGKDPEGILKAYFIDYVRTRSLLWLFATFMVFSILISGWKGVRGLIGMAISLGVILLYIIPQILQGGDPIWISVSGAFFILAVTLYLIYGWTLKTHAAVLSTLISLVVTALLASFFVDLTRLTGFGSEEALFLLQQSDIPINLRGLVLGGMLIGALGVLDDLIITQSSVVFELHRSNPGMVLNDLFRRAMRVGQDHVAATVNTLVLAYAGAALPMLMLFSLSGEQFSYLLNLEFVTEEIVRTFVGSLGLIAAVPLTTLLACLVALHHERLGALRKYLGPLTIETDPTHRH
jgi:uncharacterized membrane protein